MIKKRLIFLFLLVLILLVGCKPTEIIKEKPSIVEEEIIEEQPSIVEPEKEVLAKKIVPKEQPRTETLEFSILKNIRCPSCLDRFYHSISNMKVLVQRGNTFDKIVIEYNPEETTPMEILVKINDKIAASFG